MFEKVQVNRGQAQRILDYLVKRPYEEVHELVNILLYAVPVVEEKSVESLDKAAGYIEGMGESAR